MWIFILPQNISVLNLSIICIRQNTSVKYIYQKKFHWTKCKLWKTCLLVLKFVFKMNFVHICLLNVKPYLSVKHTSIHFCTVCVTFYVRAGVVDVHQVFRFV